ncbi:MAG: threonine ammonia-lyase [Bacteroidales bacterium]|jgi:threonine dehydratase|nr:threonine ammonia-lyase [Bacteroidales bacterium]MDD2204854.1 threonine ammonia-lyase [Bacteroidales bacterium]MDD3914320.1 threonine ammonia-lyase [Bacteroidales bacterium]MDD4634131.1 threonine ammonia-lyase [Bacteroidales bacterium]
MIKYSDIISAQSTLDGIIKVTNLLPSKSFSQMSGANVFLKLENLQTTGAFKVRGAYNKIANLPKEDTKNGVVAASAGNHAQGVAFASTHQGLKSTIFMPVFTPPLKVIATKSYGADVVLSGETFDDAFAASQVFCNEHKASYIHPFNDPMIIAGQGTIGLEIYNQCPKVDAVVVPIGGGGLIAGIALAIKNINPKIKVIGVQAAGAPSMLKSIAEKKIITLPSVHTIADGIAVKTPGSMTFDIVEKYVDELVTVTDTEIAHTAYLLLQRCKILAEPAGVTSVAAVLFKKCDFAGKNVVPVVSGGNINMQLLEQIVEKGMMEEGLRATIQIIMPDQSGELKKLLDILQSMKANVVNILHERSNVSIPIGYVLVNISFGLQDKSQLDLIVDKIKERGLSVKVIK